MDTEYPTNKDLESYPAIFMTADNDWNPSIYDNYYDLLVQEASETSSETNTFQSTNSQEISIFETSWSIMTLTQAIYINMMTQIFTPVLDMPI